MNASTLVRLAFIVVLGLVVGAMLSGVADRTYAGLAAIILIVCGFLYMRVFGGRR